MADRIRWVTGYVLAWCVLDDEDCGYAERVEMPGPDQQKVVLRHAREHALRTGHRVSVERPQTAVIEP